MDRSGARSVHPGQFRLVRLQIANWGTFPGYKDLPVDERGVLFTGPSGSGKSSLLDAHSVALLPSRDQGFNASTDMTAKGAKQSTRSTADYVRGAWAENDDEHGQSQVRYLRGGKPTWSAIGATYDDRLGTVVTGVVIRWFTGTETDGAHLRALHQIHDGPFDLNELEEWANRRFDVRWLKSAFPGPFTVYPPSESEYRRQLSKRIGLAGSKTAVSLLGKAKAMKNVGDLNMFIRDNMLDVPETFASAQTMVGAFQPLNEAFETAQRAYLQEQVLHSVPDDWAAYCEAKTEANIAGTVQGPTAEAYLRGIHLGLIDREIAALTASVTELTGQLADETERAGSAKHRYVSLRDQLRDESSELRDLESDRVAAADQQEARTKAYALFCPHVERLALTPPETLEDFQALRRELPRTTAGIESRKRANEPLRREATLAAGKAAEEYRKKTAELEALRTTGSLIPRRALDQREEIARAARIDVSSLPYAAELIDVAESEERWRPAAEKVLRGFALRLLVPEAVKDDVTAFIDQNDMRGIVEYSLVTAASAHEPRPAPGSLAAKLTVDTDHPSGRWLAGQVARQFTHACVETARELEQHPLGVTVLGTVKFRGNRYRKDDRPELTRRSSYLLGANTAAKLEALEVEAAALKTASISANSEETRLNEEWDKIRSAAEAAGHLDSYSAWNDLDHWSAAQAVRDLDERIKQVKADNVNLQQLEEDRDKAEKKWEDLVRSCGRMQDEITRKTDQSASLSSDRDRERPKPHQVDDTDRGYLDEILSDTGHPDSAERMASFKTQFTRELETRERAANRDRDAAAERVNNAIKSFLEKWRDSAPDDSGDMDRSGGDFAALHEEIATRRLPDAMERFQNIIAGDMLPSISILYRKIEEATADIKSKLTMVNAGLRRIEFNTGSHLQISTTGKPPDSAREFRNILDQLHKRAPSARTDGKDALKQFNQIRELMQRFTDEDAESRHWRETLLDVRLAYTFYGREENPDGETMETYRNTAAGSGGEQEKLVAFCLAAALSYNLADRDSGGVPRFAPLMLDEAFSKSDETFASQALAAFAEFGFQLIMAAPIRMSGVLEPFIGQAVLVEKRIFPDGALSNAASATFGELAARRQSETDGLDDAAA